MSSFAQGTPAADDRKAPGLYLFGPGARSLADFYQQLAVLLHAGLPVLRALDTLAEQTGSGIIRRRIPEMKKHIEGGGNLAGAFALFPGLFDTVHVAMLRAAEQAGRVDGALDKLSEMCRRRSGLVKKLVTGMLYPFALINMALFLVPLIERLHGAERSYLRLALPRLGIFYGALVIVFVLPRVLAQVSALQYAFDVLKGCVPVYGGVSRKLALARLARSLEGLYASGVGVAEALPVAADATGSEILRRRVLAVLPAVQEGARLSQAMRDVGGFPATFLNLLAAGEEGGRVPEMLGSVADYCEEDADTALGRLAVILPVIVYLGVAAYVGFQIISAWGSLLSGYRPTP